MLFIANLLMVGLTACDLGDYAERLSATLYEFMDDDTDDKDYNSPTSSESVTERNNKTEEKKTAASSDNGIQVYSVEGALIEPEISVIEVDKNEETQDETLLHADDIYDKYTDSAVNNYCYGYDQLGTSGKQTYLELYAILSEQLEEVEVSTKNPDEIDLAFKCVMLDHPEIFFVKGYSIGKYMYGDTIDKIVVSGTYTMNKDEVKAKKPLIEEYVTNVIAKAPQGDDYVKIKYVYEYLVKNNEYNENAENNQNILSVVENNSTVCQGYAKMTQLLLNRMGIFCTLVNGQACGSNGTDMSGKSSEWGAHVWNIVRCNNRYYNVDTTWGDAAFTLMNSGDDALATLDINYEFFLVDDRELIGTHKAKPVVKMPICASIDDNYYVREGRYFNNVDPDKLRSAFENAYANGEKILCIKMSTDNVFKDMVYHLIDEKHIFDYTNQDNVKYLQYPERRMFMFSL